LILDAPVVPHTLGKALGVIGQTANELAGFAGDFRADVSFGLDPIDLVEVFLLTGIFQSTRPIAGNGRCNLTNEWWFVFQ
jgi:hypothetical protein